MPAWALPEREPGEWVIRSKQSGRVLAKMPDGALYFEQCYWPFLESDDFDRLPEALAENMWCAVQSPPGPLVSGPDGPRLLAEGAKALRARTDRAIVGLFGGNLLEIGQFLYRNDNFLMLLAADPDRAHEFLDRLVEIHLANLERYLAAVGPYIDIIVFGDDLGMQNGPQMSRAMYREMFMPRHARMWKRAKELADVKVMLHCCGGIRPLLPDLIEAGLDAVNPVQITCAGMDAAALKADFGDKITFWGGGCDTRFVLSKATPRGHPAARSPPGRDLEPRRRLRLPAGPQRPGRCPAGERDRHVRRAGVRTAESISVARKAADMAPVPPHSRRTRETRQLIDSPVLRRRSMQIVRNSGRQLRRTRRMNAYRMYHVKVSLQLGQQQKMRRIESQ